MTYFEAFVTTLQRAIAGEQLVPHNVSPGGSTRNLRRPVLHPPQKHFLTQTHIHETIFNSKCLTQNKHIHHGTAIITAGVESFLRNQPHVGELGGSHGLSSGQVRPGRLASSPLCGHTCSTLRTRGCNVTVYR